MSTENDTAEESRSPNCYARKESVEQEFRDELNDLLKKWGAEIEAEDHYPGSPECGEDVRMTVEIPSLYDEHGNVVRERCEVDLGSSVQAR